MTHLSAFQLDALGLGEQMAGAREHLDTCARCRTDLEAAAALREHFVARVLPRTTVRVPRRRWSWLAWLALPALATAAAVLLVVAPHHHHPDGAVPALAIKGDAAWQVFANRGGKTFAVHDGTKLANGDRIRFAVIPGGAHYLIVASIDGAGAVSIYFPYGGSASGPISPGERVELPDSIVLDDAPGPERIFAVFSDVPIETSAVVDRLRSIGADGPDSIRRARSLTVAGLRDQTSLVFEKSPP